MFAATPFVICHNLGFVGRQKTERSRGKGELVTSSQPSYIRASDVNYVIFLTHAQTVDTRLSFSTRPRIALEPGDEANSTRDLEIAVLDEPIHQE